MRDVIRQEEKVAEAAAAAPVAKRRRRRITEEDEEPEIQSAESATMTTVDEAGVRKQTRLEGILSRIKQHHALSADVEKSEPSPQRQRLRRFADMEASKETLATGAVFQKRSRRGTAEDLEEESKEEGKEEPEDLVAAVAQRGLAPSLQDHGVRRRLREHWESIASRYGGDDSESEQQAAFHERMMATDRARDADRDREDVERAVAKLKAKFATKKRSKVRGHKGNILSAK